MYALPLKGNDLHNAEIEYDGKFGYTIGRMQHISIMRRIEICYTSCRLATQTMAPTIHVFQGINRCIQYLAIHPHKPIFYPSSYCDDSNAIRLT